MQISFLRPAVPPPLRIKPAFYENTGFMRSAPVGLATLGRCARLHKPRQPALIEAQRAGCHVLCSRLRYPLRHPAQETELFLCVRSSKTPHTSRAPGYASPRRRIKTSSASCARPARAIAKPPCREDAVHPAALPWEVFAKQRVPYERGVVFAP